MRLSTFGKLILILILCGVMMNDSDAVPPTNTDESKVPDYELPDVLRFTDGTPVASPEDWNRRRREILRLFETNVYGRTPKGLPKIEYEVFERGDALDGRAIREQIRMRIADKLYADLLMYRPKGASRGVFVGLNFYGNQSITDDPAVPINEHWMRSNSEIGIVDHRATGKTRGANARRWPISKIIDHGYAVVTCYCGDFDPDRYKNSFDDGIHPLYYKPGQTKPADDEWGSIGAWAWGLSRIMDYLETRNDLDPHRVAVMGHSRLGKTALWAGAQDSRFAITISNDSGCGGAALFRRRFGERIDHMARTLPDWFCVNYRKFVDRENELPVDQHMLIALIAPRPVYIASAEEDTWADPRGEFLSALHAHPVYRLLGKEGLPATSMPAVNQPVMGTIGYHIRSGPHDVTEFDWEQYLKFADKHFGFAK